MYSLTRTLQQFSLYVTLEEGSNLEVIYQLKIIGLVINEVFRRQPHVNLTDNVARGNKASQALTAGSPKG